MVGREKEAAIASEFQVSHFFQALRDAKKKLLRFDGSFVLTTTRKEKNWNAKLHIGQLKYDVHYVHTTPWAALSKTDTTGSGELATLS